MKKYALFLLLVCSFLLVSGCGDTKKQTTETPQVSSPQVKTPESPVSNPADKNDGDSESNNSTPAKTLSWYLIPNKQHLTPGINNSAADMLSQNQAIYALPNDSKKIYLTFDCGYELGYTPAILDVLQRQQIKAAFFITGQYIETQPDLVKRMHTEGHLVCNHTWNHPDLSTVNQEKLNQEISRLASRYEEITGAPIDKYLRPPMGNYSSSSLQWTKDLGYTTVFWSMAWKDWDPKQQPGTAFVIQHVEENIHPGAIILMHVVSSSDTEALDTVISDLKSQGYVFSTF